MLDKNYCKIFFRELQKFTAPERAQNFIQENFDELFDAYDLDVNGAIDRNEIVVFIKKAFAKPKVSSGRDRAKQVAKEREANQKSLTTLLGNFAENFKIDIEEIW